MVQDRDLVVGVDLGKTKVAMVVLERCGSVWTEPMVRCEPHQGEPFAVFSRLAADLDLSRVVAMVATGVYRRILHAPVEAIPEDIAIEARLRHDPLYAGQPLTVLRMGAQGSSVVVHDGQGHFQYREHDRCASGTGSAITQLLSRFGLDLETACRESLDVTAPIAIQARCAVFAKSEMTHQANRGENPTAIVAGFFDSIARSAVNLLRRAGNHGRTVLIGGVAKNPRIRRTIATLLDQPVQIAEDSAVFEARGAALFAAQRAGASPRVFPAACAELKAARRRTIDRRLPLPQFAAQVQVISAHAVSPVVGEALVLGLDLGSTGTKAAVVGFQSRHVYRTEYCETLGDPVGASQKLVARLINGPDAIPVVTAIGVTGSGRDVAATVLRACFPGLNGALYVENEIIAHATAAIHFDPEHGRSLSIVEIGGQDAKFINIRNGQITDSDMNKACSAGTGSYLAEQARHYGLDIVEVGDQAMAAATPVNLGSFCTVFVSDQADRAREEGYTPADILAGFHYSVVVNYLHRVMGNRTFGDRIFFQGKPATSLALDCALAGVTGRPVLVPENPGAMGAVGIALRAITKATCQNPGISLACYGQAQRVEHREFPCGDRQCGNRCRIARDTVRIGDETRRVFSGGSCPKFESVTAVFPKLERGAPDAFAERRALFDRYCAAAPAADADAPTVSIPLGLAFSRLAPFFVAYFRSLGFSVVPIAPSSDTLQDGEQIAACYDFCAPAKIMHGLCARAQTDYLFLPHISELPRDGDEPFAQCCPIVQGLPYVIASAVGATTRVLTPQLSFAHGWQDAAAEAALARCLQAAGKSSAACRRAFRHAAAAQAAYLRDCAAIGERVLAYAAAVNAPVVVVLGRPYVLHDPVLQSQIPHLIARQGCLPLPADCYPFQRPPENLALLFWKEGLFNLRVALDTLTRTSVSTLWLTCYTCGPDAFLEHFYHRMMYGRPHTILETDGHRGEAGFATRVQAFLSSVAESRPTVAGKAPRPSIGVFQHLPSTTLSNARSRILFPPMGDILSHLLAAALRSQGLDADVLPPHDGTTLSVGKGQASGKECLPFVMVWGALRRYLNEAPGNERITYVVPTSCGPCRYGMYEVLIRQLLEEQGLSGRVQLYTPGTKDGYGFEFGDLFRLRLWAAFVYADLLRELLLYVRPAAQNPAEVDCLYQAARERAIRFVETPVRDSMANYLRAWGLPALLSGEAARFAAIPCDAEKAAQLRTVAMVGEIYVRLDDPTNSFTIRRLEANGLRVKLVGAREWVDFVTELGAQRGSVRMWCRRYLQRYLRLRLARAGSPLLSPRHEHPARRVMQRAAPYMGVVGGEANLTIGGPLLMHEAGEIDGVVVMGPQGCMPTKLAEAQLCQMSLPSLFLYMDGEPYDERAVESFAWRLRSGSAAAHR
ncbi:MAG: BadF/BadG/BcrA/BcrD ATPase family protein [Patescibacteria group bacterium]|nr:BadF/BadG/BcrA/BcrD ATPase family protein [Patescibacteria group bacterium]